MKCEILDPKTAPNRTWRWRSSRSVAPCITLRRVVGCLFSNSARAIPISLNPKLTKRGNTKAMHNRIGKALKGRCDGLHGLQERRLLSCCFYTTIHKSSVLTTKDRRMPKHAQTCFDVISFLSATRCVRMRMPANVVEFNIPKQGQGNAEERKTLPFVRFK